MSLEVVGLHVGWEVESSRGGWPIQLASDEGNETRRLTRMRVVNM